MAAYKRQHWLPASYLKFFAIDGEVRRRASRVWVTDGDSKAIRTVRNVAVSSWTYSRNNAEAVEQSFAEMERDYPELVVRVASGAPFGKRDQLLLASQMLEFHFRNAKYEIADGSDRFDVYSKWGAHFLQSDMAGFTEGKPPSDLQALADGLARRWACAIITNLDSDLMTCDNPSFLHTDSEGRLAFGLLPLTPKHLGICFRNDTVVVRSNSMTAADASRINGLMAAQCITNVISSHEPDSDEMRAVRRLRKKHRRRPFMTVNRLEPGFWRDYIPIPSFMELF